MHIDWPTLGVWFLVAVGVFAVGYLFCWWGSKSISHNLIDIPLLGTSLWILATGVLRSTTSLGLPLCWFVGLVLISSPLCPFWQAPFLVWDVICDFWHKHQEKRTNSV